MKGKLRRLLSFALVTVMALSLVPTAVAADPEPETLDKTDVSLWLTDENGGLFHSDGSGDNLLITSYDDISDRITLTGWDDALTIGQEYTVTLKADGMEGGAPYVLDGGEQKFVLQEIELMYSSTELTARQTVWSKDSGETSSDGKSISFSVTPKAPTGNSSTDLSVIENKNTLFYIWALDEDTRADFVSVTYDLTSGLPDGGHVYYIEKYNGVYYAPFAEGYVDRESPTITERRAEGTQIPYYPATLEDPYHGKLETLAGLIGGVPTTPNGNIIETYYRFDGWKVDGGDNTIYTEGNMPKVSSEAESIKLVAQWSLIDFDNLELTEEQKAVEVPFADKWDQTGTDAMISQHASGSSDWSQEGTETDALPLNEDLEVSYKAELKMNPLIAVYEFANEERPILATQPIKDPDFAHFNIEVRLDEALDPIADEDGNVTFTFTCRFLRPETAEGGGKNTVIKDTKGNILWSGSYTGGRGTYTYSVPAEDLTTNTFVLPMEWNPGKYEADQLTSTISLEVAATKVDEEKYTKPVATTGVITGEIDLSKAGKQETDVVSFLIAGDKDWRAAFMPGGEMESYDDILKAAKRMKESLENITLNANTVYARTPGYSVTVNYVDQVGNPIADSVTLDDVYSKDAVVDLSKQLNEDIPGYEKVREDVVSGGVAISENDSITMGTSDVVIDVIYAKTYTVTIRYYDRTNGEVFETTTMDAVYTEGTAVPLDEELTRTFGGYTLVGVRDNDNLSGTTLTMPAADVVLYVEYTKDAYTVRVNYLDVDTGEQIANSYFSDKSYEYGEEYNVTDALRESIGRYDLVEDSYALTGTVYGDVVINLYYDRGYTPRPDPGTDPDPDPDRPGDGDDTTDIADEEVPLAELPGLNKEDHFAYIIGYEDGTVRPEGYITRAEVATIFFRLMTDEYRETYWATSNLFTDVAQGNWYNNGVSTTANVGWISGYPDSTYRPNNNITRAEFATIASRFLSGDYTGGNMFNDIDGHWAADYINRAASIGWITGYPDGSFHPDAYITRAEAVTLINRMLDRAPDADHMLENMIRWPDNPETAWYYEAIQEATNSHDYDRETIIDFETWTVLLENRDWAALEELWAQAGDATGGEVADNLTPNVPGDDN